MFESIWQPIRAAAAKWKHSDNLIMGQIVIKNTVIYGEITVFGTPGETRTHYLALRRRALYPGELRGHLVTQSIVPKNGADVNKRKEILFSPV